MICVAIRQPADLDDVVVVPEVGSRVHELLEVKVKVLEDQVQAAIAVADIVKPAVGADASYVGGTLAPGYPLQLQFG